MKIALINVGGNKGTPCQGPIFEDGKFIFIPIPESGSIEEKKKFPTYESLKLNKYIPEKYHGAFAHYDPHFPSLTYGHIKRGFGYEKILKSLNKGDVLSFYSTLKYKGNGKPAYDWINEDWGTYMIGAYLIDYILTDKSFKNLSKSKQKDFENNPHYLRKKRVADYWIRGTKRSPGLFNKAFPLHDNQNKNRGNEFLKENFTTSSGKKASGEGYYRHAFICTKRAEEIWGRIKEHIS
ncbi:MAG: hypothetical protein ACTSP3_03800 [Candidatus Heimdallarchaeaceae archaeon]